MKHRPWSDRMVPLSRREFLRKSAGAVIGAGAALTIGGIPTAAEDASPVIIARNQAVTVNGKPQKAVLEQLVDKALMSLSGEKDARKAWESFFSADDVVGIKPNGIAGPTLSTATALIQTCVERLQGIGVKPQNIIIWEQSTGHLRSCGIESDRPWGAMAVTRAVGYSDPIVHGAFRGRVTTVITKQVDAILNLPILKDHSGAGITASMKNHYGSIDNPGANHGPNKLGPNIADLNSLPAIKNKTRLIICDATRAICNGGPGANPQWMWNYNGILAATDPVAHDTVCWQLIEQRRKQVGVPPIMGDGSPPPQLPLAAERGLGKHRWNQIKIVQI